MAPAMTMISLLGALALAGGVSASCKDGCFPDRCVRAVRYATTGPVSASRIADCSSFLEVTVTPAASTAWVTEYKPGVTVTVTTERARETPTPSTPSPATVDTLYKKRATTPTPPASPTNKVPAYVSACSDAAQYGSACSCWGVSPSTVTAFVAPVTSTTTLTTTVTQYDYESPPLPSSSVVFPSDDSWTATYTWSEYTLPVFTSAPDPSVEVTYPTPTSTCLMSATPTGDAFYLLAPGDGYVVKRNGGLGPVEQPANEAAAAALKASWNPPTFEFRAAQNAPDGLFDLVLRDGSNADLYVALDVQTGAISLVPSSTNGVAQNGKSTTVFGGSCRGSLVLAYGSVSYIWTTTDSGTIATPGSPATDNTETLNTMLLLPARIRTSLNRSSPSASKRSKVPGTTVWKRDMSQYGVAARCPGFTGKMVAVSNGRSPSPPNGCGPDSAWYSALVPNLNFGGCCNTHDVCYDDCSQWFEKCNTDFLSCMLNTCNDKYDHWYSWWLLPSCYAAADLYFVAVSGDTAQDHFQEGSNDVCACRCADADFAICAPETKTCQRVRGLGNNDSKNCGGCGRDCGPRAHCSDGQCLCNPAPPTPDQCGNMCLDFLTHPRHCGRCNNVCPKGYCYQGACFTPPDNADKCYPVDAVANGDFSAGLTGWSVSSAGGAPINYNIGTGVNGNGKSLATFPTQPVKFTDSPWDTIGASTTLRLCAGVQYKLDFQTYTNDPMMWVSVVVGGHTISERPTSVGPLNVWVAQGPYTLPVFKKGDAGTSQGDGFFLNVPLYIGFFGSRDTDYSTRLADVAVYSTGE